MLSSFRTLAKTPSCSVYKTAKGLIPFSHSWILPCINLFIHHPYTHSSTYPPSIHPFIHHALIVYPSIYLSISPCTLHPPIHFSTHPSIHSSIYPSIYPVDIASQLATSSCMLNPFMCVMCAMVTLTELFFSSAHWER